MHRALLLRRGCGEFGTQLVQAEKSSLLAYKGSSCPCSAALAPYKGWSLPGVWGDMFVPGMKDRLRADAHHLLPAEKLNRTVNSPTQILKKYSFSVVFWGLKQQIFLFLCSNHTHCTIKLNANFKYWKIYLYWGDSNYLYCSFLCLILWYLLCHHPGLQVFQLYISVFAHEADTQIVGTLKYSFPTHRKIGNYYFV